jgi:excisionase family DNA binding protein
MSRLIDIDELADYLKLKKQTIYNWLNQRKISGIKVGGVWRFDRKDIDNWLRSKKRESTTTTVADQGDSL